MTDRINILVTGVGGPTPRSFVRSILESACERYRFVGVDANPLGIGLYDRDSYLDTYVVPEADSDDYWSAIGRIVNRHEIALAVVMPEVEVLAWARAQEEHRLPCKAFVPAYQASRVLVDKKAMHDVLHGKQYLPKHCTFSNGADIGDLPLPYPFWVRATTGSSGLGSLKVNNRQALDEWVRINPAVEEFIASEFLPGRNLACKLLYVDGQLLRSACAERVEYIMAKVAPSGITGNTAFGRLINDRHLVDIADDAIREVFARHGIQPHGVFTADLKEAADGQPMITEINVRCVAFVSALARAGANLPLDYLEANLNPDGFSFAYRHYVFQDDMIFLRDVDEAPVVMKESELLTREAFDD
ncbi:hypothetical protein [Halomonas stenophila]|uniref:Carbamoyl-phosphate synthase large subunit n=1 Tax=Halomonas stenophila TaxID=795312 RepID=A0A7W5ERP5_9GAMM|nr:hypothetical protein [Halomonas stenophila]MBB3229545.1 carbamoyl-phosphate synthase large subunit [Halomonas stenophila]